MKFSKATIVLIVVLAVVTFFTIKNFNIEKTTDEEILKNVNVVADGKINSKNEGKLVLVTGKISFDGKVVFEELDAPINTFKAVRTVKDFVESEKDGKKHYDWIERTEPDPNAWGSSILDYLYSTEITLPTKVGDFVLDDYGMNLVKTSAHYHETANIGGLKWDGMKYGTNKDDDDPGDVSIEYDYFNVDENEYLSIIAQQSGNTFKPYKINKIDTYYVFNGKLDSMDKLKEQINIKQEGRSRGRITGFVLIAAIVVLLYINHMKGTAKKAGDGDKPTEKTETKQEEKK